MEHLGTIPLETERLLLRRFVPEDAEAMFRNWASDPEVTKYLTWQTYENADVARATMAGWCPRYAEPDWYMWAVVPKTLGEPVGSISVTQYLKDGRCAELGACIGRAWWGQGLVAEALREILRFLFEEVGMPEVGACNDVNNPNSGRAQEKAGLIYRTTLIGQGTNNQGVCDLDRHSLTREEYYKIIR